MSLPSLISILTLALATGTTALAKDVVTENNRDEQARLVVQLGHDKSIGHATFSDDGKLALTEDPGTVILWDIATGAEIRRFEWLAPDLATSGPGWASISPDRRLVATPGESSRVVVLWNARDGKRKWDLACNTSVVHAAFTPDGQHIIGVTRDATVHTWSTDTGQLEHAAYESDWYAPASFSPSGDRVVCFSQVFDSKTGQALTRFENASSTICQAVFSLDGRMILTGDAIEPCASLWDAATGKRIRVLNGHKEAVPCVIFSPDGDRVATGSEDGTAFVWCSTTGEKVCEFEGHKAGIRQLLWSSDGRYVISHDQAGEAHLRCPVTGHTKCVFPETGQVARADSTPGKWKEVLISPNGKAVVTVKGHEDVVRVWDCGNDEGVSLIGEFGTAGIASAIRFAPDGKHLVVGYSAVSPTLLPRRSKGIGVWKVTTGKKVRHIDMKLPLNVSPSEICFSPVSTLAAAVATGQPILQLFDSKSGKVVFNRSLAHLGPPIGEHPYCRISPDGRLLLAGHSGAVEVWDIGQHSALFGMQRLRRRVSAASLMQNGRSVVLGNDDGCLYVRDSRSSRQRLLLREELRHSEGMPSFSFFSISCSRDGSRIVTCDSDATTRVYKVDPAGELVCFQEADCEEPLAFSPDGEQFYAFSRLYETRTGKEIRRFVAHPSILSSVAFSPNGKYLATGGSRDAVAELWDKNSGLLIRTFGSGAARTKSLAFSPDGCQLLTVRFDGVCVIWDTETGVESTRLGQDAPVFQAAFSPDNRRLATTCQDGTLRLWDATSGAQMKVIGELPARVFDLRYPDDPPDGEQRDRRPWPLAYSPTGREIATGGDDGTIRIWSIEQGKMIREWTIATTVRSVAFCKDGEWLISDERKSSYVPGAGVFVRLWDAKSGRLIRSYKCIEPGIKAMAVAANGEWLLTRDSTETGEVALHKIDTGEVRYRVRSRRNAPRRCELSPSGRRLLVSMDDSAYLRDVNSGALVRAFPGTRGAFSKDGSRIITCDVDKAHVWDATTGDIARTLTGEQIMKISILRWPTASQLLLSGRTAKKASLSVWNTGMGRESFRAEIGSRSISYDRDFRRLLCAAPEGDRFMVLDSGTGEELWRSPRGVVKEPHFEGLGTYLEPMMRGALGLWGQIAVAISPEGERLVTTDPAKGAGRLWDIASGKAIASLDGHSGPIAQVVFSPNDKYLLTRSLDGSDRLWDAKSGEHILTLQANRSWLMESAFSPDGRSFLAAGTDGIELWDLTGRRPKATFPWDSDGIQISPAGAVLSGDGRRLLTRNVSSEPSSKLYLWDTTTGRQVAAYGAAAPKSSPLRVPLFRGFYWFAFSPDSRYALIHNQDNVDVFDANSGEPIVGFQGATTSIRGGMGFGTSARCTVEPALSQVDSLVCCVRGITGTIWNYASGQRLSDITEPAYTIDSVEFSPDGRHLLGSCRKFGLVRLWSVAKGELLCSLISFANGVWVVVTPEGRFDTNNLDKVSGLRWTMPDDPFTPLPIETFMRDYYEPRLLGRILAGETFKPIRDLQKLNRVQPSVRILEVVQQPEAPDEVAVTVAVANRTGIFERQSEIESGVFDLRLFRDGQLVCYHPAEDGAVPLNENQEAVIRFDGIRIPRRRGYTEVEFSAYAFNSDRVKSETHHVKYAIPPGTRPRRGNAYIVCVGVNAFDTSEWDLRCAAGDARLLSSMLGDALRKTGQFNRIAPVHLVSDFRNEGGHRIVTENQATKNNVRNVLGLLAGQALHGAAIEGIPGAKELSKANPEDLVVISFSTHGHNGDDGRFYLFPSDIGNAADPVVTNDLLSRLICTDELSLWLRDVDAGEMVLIVDACHSAATVEQEGFKPGPMGSRGLGQLAYDKRMRILAASQSSDVALEDERIGYGLLTYALCRNGLAERKADFAPADGQIMMTEWLQYGVRRVPDLAAEIVRGEIDIAAHGNRAGDLSYSERAARLLKKRRWDRPVQLPALFDFGSRGDDIMLDASGRQR